MARASGQIVSSGSTLVGSCIRPPDDAFAVAVNRRSLGPQGSSRNEPAKLGADRRAREPCPERSKGKAMRRTLFVVLVVALAASCGSGGGQRSSGPVVTKAGLGQPVRDEDFEFTVLGVQCGVSGIPGASHETASGQFCLARVRVTNV